ncbi:MAG: LRV FeS4 cluster domain-containing protein, partial [Caenispirillum sp.]|nr:LRV FeS4 cluster domain-containing protein [Caenispirillum sp.]
MSADTTSSSAEGALRTGEPVQAIDWQGRPVSCSACEFRDGVLAKGLCKPMLACVHDRYAKRIERFFDTNPELSDIGLSHPHFEVRAISVRHASIFKLPALLADPDPEVRAAAVMRLPARQALRLRADA